MKNGETRRGPLSVQERGLGDRLQPADARADQHAGAPPVRLVLGLQPASATACSAAAMREAG